MKTIREIQFEKVKQVYRELRTFKDEKPDLNTINVLANEVLSSTLRTPMCGKYRVPRHTTVDVASLNAEMGLIKADAESIYDFIDQMQKKLSTMKYVAEVWKQNAANKIKNTMIELAQMTSPSFVQGFTEELDLASVLDQDNTSLIIDSDNSVTLPMVVNNATRYKHRTNDVNIKPVGENLTSTILGNPTSVVNMDENGVLTLTLTGKTITEAGFEITLNTDTKEVNYIYLKMSGVRNGVKVKARVSPDKADYTNVYDSVVTRDQVDIPMEETDVQRLVLTLTMDAPNVVLMNEVRYEFKIEKLLLLSDKRKLSGIYQTKEIPISSDIAFVSLAVEDESIGDVILKYYVATEKDTSGNPTGFFYIDPKDEGSLVNMQSTSSSIRLTPDSANPRWQLSGLKTYGSRLYNIFDILGTGVSEETEDFKIEDGKLVIKDGELIQDTIKLYRGINDYVKLEKEVLIERNVDWLAYTPEPHAAIDWVQRIPLCIKLNELIDSRNISHSGGGLYNQVTIPYELLNYEEIRVTRDDGREVPTLVSDVTYSGGESVITFSASAGTTVLDPNYKHYISFIVTLKEYINTTGMEVTIDLDSVRIGAGDDDLIYGVDFDVYKNEMEIELRKSGQYLSHYDVDYTNPSSPVNNNTPIVVSYKFTGDTGKLMSFFQTYVYVEVPTDIVIRPFTTGELASGNFHMINDEHVGARPSYTLKQGWNKLESTQPFPSRNEYDLNTITGKVSRAGIVIPGNIEYMRPYKDSMRQVAPFILATMDLEEGSKCFSYVDGKMLINFVPTSVEQSFLDEPLTSDIKGDKFLNKKAVWGVSYDNVGWTALPETFYLEFSYTSSGDKQVYVRITIECEDNKSVARVFRVGLNKYREV